MPGILLLILRGCISRWGDGEKFSDRGRGFCFRRLVFVVYDELLIFTLLLVNGNWDIRLFGLKLALFISFSRDKLRGLEAIYYLFI